MAKNRAEHCVMVNQGVQCLHCGDIHKLAIPMPVSLMADLLDGFASRHGKCKKEWTPPTIDPQYPINERIKFWLNNSELGTSVVTIYNRIMHKPGYKLYGWHDSHPHDADDFRRCYLLFKIVPEWKENILLMKGCGEVWDKLVDNWDNLTNMLETSMASATGGNAKEMNEFMKTLGC